MSDGPRRLAAFALTPVRDEWRRAMLAELDHVEGRAARWRFALGCVRVAAMPARAGRYAAGLLAGGAVLVAYGLVRWPGIADDAPVVVGYLTWLGLLLAGYAWLAATVRPDRRLAASGGTVAALAWAGSLVALELDAYAVAGLAACAALVAVGVTAATSGLRAGAGALLIVGLAAFVTVLLIAYLATDRVAADPVLLDEFRASGARDAVTYAVGETMAVAVNQLWMAPALCGIGLLVGGALRQARHPA